MLTAKPANSKSVLICGDSFAADWTVKYSGRGWPNLLAQQYRVTNAAQAGCSEYKIFQQLQRHKLDRYHTVIVWHTSPFRIPVQQHPVHWGDPLHGNSDLLYTDCKEHAQQIKDLEPVVDFYEKYFDTDYAIFVYRLIVEQILIRTHSHANVVHATAQDWDDIGYSVPGMINFHKLWRDNTGLINHFDSLGNEKVLEKIKENINE